MTTVRNMVDNASYPIFEAATKDDMAALMDQLKYMQYDCGVVVATMIAMTSLIRFRRNLISALDVWIKHPYSTVFNIRTTCLHGRVEKRGNH